MKLEIKYQKCPPPHKTIQAASFWGVRFSFLYRQKIRKTFETCHCVEYEIVKDISLLWDDCREIRLQLSYKVHGMAVMRNCCNRT